MPAHKRKPAAKLNLYELIHEVTSDFINGRLVRCAKCRQLQPEVISSVVSCSVCIFISGRCEGCGGEAGAVRSVKAHMRALSQRRLVRYWGDAHKRGWDQYYGFKARRKALKIMRGGKK